MSSATTSDASKARKPFKDWFDRAAARALANQVSAVHPSFDTKGFVRRATKDLAALEFSDRVRQFSSALAATLDLPAPKALGVLTDSLPPALPDCEAVTDGWLQWPVGQFIADYGVDHFDEAMVAMEALTQRFSSEFAVRPFVERYPEQAFAHLAGLTAHDSPHVRRWCSEGIRPRLPWGRRLKNLIADPTPIWPILEALKDDPELYVRRSVANNANDIAKDHPQQVVKRCKAWLEGADAPRRWVIKQSLRSLVKAKDPAALSVLGFGPPKGVEAQLSVRPARATIGGAVILSLALKNSGPRARTLLIDYAVHYVRKNGSTAPKVFKWTSVELGGRAETSLEKKHSLRPTTTRTLHAGQHRIVIQINGADMAEGRFTLKAP